MTGHGSFGDYLERIKKKLSRECYYCGDADSAEHTVFFCPRFEEKRICMAVRLGVAPTADNVVELALKSKSAWRDTMGVIHDIMRRKEEDMRM